VINQTPSNAQIGPSARLIYLHQSPPGRLRAGVRLMRWQGFSRGVIDPLVIGYLSHLAADLLTSSGLRLAWPLPQRQAITLCRTGSLSESIIEDHARRVLSERPWIVFPGNIQGRHPKESGAKGCTLVTVACVSALLFGPSAWDRRRLCATPGGAWWVRGF
jgi:LexA-binding, inner membrane-associated putative hydrolase